MTNGNGIRPSTSGDKHLQPTAEVFAAGGDKLGNKLEMVESSSSATHVSLAPCVVVCLNDWMHDQMMTATSAVFYWTDLRQ